MCIIPKSHAKSSNNLSYHHIHIQGVGVASRHWSGNASEASNTSKNPTEQETSNPQGNFQLGLLAYACRTEV